jgi:hypothetical protein
MLRYVTPTLYVGEPTSLDGDLTVVPTWTAAYRELRDRGCSDEEARHRINFARTGDMYATRTAAGRRSQRRHPVDGPHSSSWEVAEL